jgi:hypothetical protein
MRSANVVHPAINKLPTEINTPPGGLKKPPFFVKFDKIGYKTVDLRI